VVMRSFLVVFVHDDSNPEGSSLCNLSPMYRKMSSSGPSLTKTLGGVRDERDVAALCVSSTRPPIPGPTCPGSPLRHR